MQTEARGLSTERWVAEWLKEMEKHEERVRFMDKYSWIVYFKAILNNNKFVQLYLFWVLD